jgi:hypothetical protein
MSLSFYLKNTDSSIQKILPYRIRYTFSKNNQTSTLTVSFYNSILSADVQSLTAQKFIKNIFFLHENYKFTTTNIQISWVKGKPLFINAIFLIISESETLKLKSLFNDPSQM